MSVAPAGAVPLPRLLALAYRQQIDALHVRLAATGWNDVRPAYGYVLLALRDRGCTTTELAAVLGVSKQAVSKLLDAMEEGQFVRRTPAEADGRTKRVDLQERGEQLLVVVEAIYADLESAWVGVLGTAAVAQLRSSLTEVLLATNSGVLPPVRPTDLLQT